MLCTKQRAEIFSTHHISSYEVSLQCFTIFYQKYCMFTYEPPVHMPVMCLMTSDDSTDTDPALD